MRVDGVERYTPGLDAQYEQLRTMERERDGLASGMALTKSIVQLAQSQHWQPFLEAITKAREAAINTMIQFGLGEEQRRECAAQARCWQWFVDRPKLAAREMPGMEQKLKVLTGQISKLVEILPERG